MARDVGNPNAPECRIEARPYPTAGLQSVMAGAARPNIGPAVPKFGGSEKVVPSGSDLAPVLGGRVPPVRKGACPAIRTGATWSVAAVSQIRCERSK